MLPVLPIGYSWVWRDIPGTVSIDQERVKWIIKDVVRSLHRSSKIERFVVISAHGANDAAMKYAVRELADEVPVRCYYFVYPGVKESAARQGDLIAEVIHLDAQGEIPRQIAAVEDLIARGVDAIVIDPISPRALEGVLKLAQSRGIPVIAASSQIPLDQVTAWVGRDDAEYGRLTALWLVEQLGGKGNIIALDGIAGNPVAEERWRGAKEVFDQ